MIPDLREKVNESQAPARKPLTWYPKNGFCREILHIMKNQELSRGKTKPSDLCSSTLSVIFFALLQNCF